MLSGVLVRCAMSVSSAWHLHGTAACAAVAGKSEKLRGASKNYVSQARYLNTQALLRKFGPLVIIVLLVVGMLWWRFRFR